MKSEGAASVVFVVDDLRSLDCPLRVRGREHLHGDSDRWNQICERYSNPHQHAVWSLDSHLPILARARSGNGRPASRRVSRQMRVRCAQ